MAFNDRSLDDYIDVPQRIAEFRERHPEGSLQPYRAPEILKVSGTDKHGKEHAGTFIVYTAAAYRSPDDQRPGIGMAWEVFPGRTPYTAGSELMNAETSAWGRAIVAVLAADAKRGVSSREEVRNRAAEQDDDWRKQPTVQVQNGRVVEDTPDVSDWEVQPDDDWGAAIEAIASAEDATAVDEELHAAFKAGKVDAGRAGELRQRITKAAAKYQPATLDGKLREEARKLRSVGSDPT